MGQTVAQPDAHDTALSDPLASEHMGGAVDQTIKFAPRRLRRE